MPAPQPSLRRDKVLSLFRDLSGRTLLRSALILFADALIAAASFYLSLRLRLGTDPRLLSPDLVSIGMPVFVTVAVPILAVFKLPQRVWRFTSIEDVFAIVRAVTLIILFFVLVLFWITRLELLPRSSLVINWFVLIAGLGAPRVLFRIYKDRGLAGLGWLRSRKDDRVPVALIGINHTAENFIRAMDSGRGGDYRVVGIIDERGDRIGRQIRNCTVVGSLATLEDTVERLAQNGDRPQRILIADEHVSRTELRNLVERADVLGISVARLPRPTDFKSGIAIDRTEIRPIAIEDLLGRPQTVLDRARMQALIADRKSTRLNSSH